MGDHSIHLVNTVDAVLTVNVNEGSQDAPTLLSQRIGTTKRMVTYIAQSSVQVSSICSLPTIADPVVVYNVAVVFERLVPLNEFPHNWHIRDDEPVCIREIPTKDQLDPYLSNELVNSRTVATKRPEPPLIYQS